MTLVSWAIFLLILWCRSGKTSPAFIDAGPSRVVSIAPALSYNGRFGARAVVECGWDQRKGHRIEIINYGILYEYGKGNGLELLVCRVWF